MGNSEGGSGPLPPTEKPADAAAAPGSGRRSFLKRATFEGLGDDTDMPDVNSTPPAGSSPVSVPGTVQLMFQNIFMSVGRIARELMSE